MINNMPTISVIMSVYKEPLNWIQESIDSILHQTISDFEFIIINDNPDDKQLRVFLEKNQKNDNRIKVIYNETNIGLTKSLNKGLQQAKGKYIARMDADDISYSSRFEQQIIFLQNNPHIGICGSSIELFGCKSGIIEYAYDNNDVFLFLETCCAHPTVMIRSEIFKSNRYNESLRVSQDFDLWTTLYGKGFCFGNIKQPLLKYRCSNTQITATKSKLQIELSCKIRRRALDDYCRLNNIPFCIGDPAVSFQLIKKLNKQIKLPDSKMRTLNYYLLSSVNTNILSFILKLTRYKLIHRIRISDFLRISYHNITNKYIPKF